MGDCIFDLSQIKEGQVVKNYKELCALLGIEVKAGKSKMCQMKEIERYLYLKSAGGNKILIKAIYPVPLAKEDGRKGGNNSVYKELVHRGMIAILRKAKNKRFICSKGYLLEELGFVNSNYRSCRSNALKTSEYLNTPQDNVLDFYSVNHTRVTKALKTNFELFRRNSYCMVHDVTIICLKDEDNLIYRVTTEDEDDLILKCENAVKREIGIKDDAEIYYRNMWDIFNEKLKKELRKHNPNINYYYDGYYFKIDRDAIEDAYDELVKGEGLTLGKIRDKINEESTKSAHDSIVRRQDNAKKRLKERESEISKGNKEIIVKKYAFERDMMLTSKDCVKHNKKCVNNLISRKANAIKLKLDKDDNKDKGNNEELSLYPENEVFLNESKRTS